MKKCECGCGGEVNERSRFVLGHNTKGRKLPKKVCIKIRNSKLGEKNPNWKPKVEFICLVCKKKEMVNPAFLKYRKTCSKKCMGKQTSKRMKEKNPMRNLKSIKKGVETRKKKYPNWGDFNKGLKRPQLSEYMKKHNPSKKLKRKKEISKTVSKFMIEKYKDPKEREKTRKKSLEIYKSGNHPFADPKKRIEMAKKARATFLRNGNISPGQKLLYKYLRKLKIKFIPEKCITRKGKGNCYFLDAYLPKQNLCIEYDGYSGHINSKRDKIRDKFLLTTLKIKTLRIKQSEIFNEKWATKLILNFVGGLKNG